jgi:hypothetical protein
MLHTNFANLRDAAARVLGTPVDRDAATRAMRCGGDEHRRMLMNLPR